MPQGYRVQIALSSPLPARLLAILLAILCALLRPSNDWEHHARHAFEGEQLGVHLRSNSNRRALVLSLLQLPLHAPGERGHTDFSPGLQAMLEIEGFLPCLLCIEEQVARCQAALAKEEPRSRERVLRSQVLRLKDGEALDILALQHVGCVAGAKLYAARAPCSNATAPT